MNLPQALPQGWWIVYRLDELFEESLSNYHYSIQDQLEDHYFFCVQSAQSALKELRNDMDFMREIKKGLKESFKHV